MDDDGELLCRQEADVLWLTLNRPDRLNALSPALYQGLAEALQRAAVAAEVGAVVLTGAGRAFCAGGDVQRMKDGEAQRKPSDAERVSVMRTRTHVIELLHHMPKPTIAMIRGAAVGAGLSLALACDLRYGDTSTRMRTGFINVGVSGDFGGHYLLPRIVGPAKARELYLRSLMLTADEAAALGLLNAVYTPDVLDGEVAAIAAALAGGPQPATALMKQNLNDAAHVELAQMLDLECRRHIECVDSAHHKEATRAFLEKRRPVFARSGPDTDRGEPLTEKT